MVRLGRWTRISAAAFGDLNPAQVLDVGAVVQLSGMAERRVANEKADRSAVLGRQARRTEPVHQNTLSTKKLERHADVKIVALGMQGHKFRTRMHPGLIQDHIERHAIALARRMKPRYVVDLSLLRNS